MHKSFTNAILLYSDVGSLADYKFTCGILQKQILQGKITSLRKICLRFKIISNSLTVSLCNSSVSITIKRGCMCTHPSMHIALSHLAQNIAMHYS